MKINLQCGNSPRNGYLNVHNSVVQPNVEISGDTRFVLGNYSDLSQIVENNPVEEIVFNHPVNVIGPDEMPKIFEHWHSVLSSGGLLKIWALDVRKIGLAIHSGDLPLKDTHALLFGSGSIQHKSVVDTTSLLALTSHLGFDTSSVSHTGFIVTVELKKRD